MLGRDIKNDNMAGVSLERKRETRDGDTEVPDIRSSKALKTIVRTFLLKPSDIGYGPTYVWIHFNHLLFPIKMFIW